MTKNAAKTLTLTATKAPGRTAAPLALPKSATSYFIDTETPVKVTVIKTAARRLAVPAGVADVVAPFVVGADVADVVAANFIASNMIAPVVVAADIVVLDATVAPDAPLPGETAAAHIPVPAPAPAPVVVRKRVSKLAALEPADAVVAETVVALVPKVLKPRVARKVEAEPTVIITAGQSVSQTTDAATLAQIDTSGYLLPSVKVPGRRGRKPSEFTPENDEVAGINAVERAELKAVSKARERKAKGALPGVLAADPKTSEADLERRRNQIKNLINMGKERGFLTHAEINDQLPENIIDPEAIEGIIAMFNDMGIAVYERAPDADMMLLTDNVPTATSDDEVEAAAATALSTVDSDFGRTTDPVRMYMREMGAVALLTREGETEIAKRIEGGLKDMVQAISACPTTIAEIIALSHKIERDEIKVDEVVDGFVDL
ncbi:MAG: RNA polymerase sigma factor RpoD, partial [Massilia sp.]|nr:RNA polymerase sigma factor RpoD [Massilia sp.]